MISFQLKKKSITIIAVTVLILSAISTGYIVWRVGRVEQIGPYETDAAYCLDADYNVLPGCIRCQCQDGAWVVGKSNSCWNLCGSLGHNKQPPSSGGYCIQGSQCPACEWPQVAYCGCSNDTSPAHNTCGCRKYNNFSCGVPCGQVSGCTPSVCPTGWISCGISGQSSATGQGCVAKTQCEGKCVGCSNEFIIKRYCKLAPECGDGALDEGEECELGDPDGVSCLWSECSQNTCTCPEDEEPFCGDGILGNTEGEECELGDPDGVSCSWDSCNQSTCTCPEEGEEPYCGDGILGNTEGEECELGNPDGVSCLWDDCDKDSCDCPEPEEVPEAVPELPETGIFDPSSLAITVSVSMIVYGGVMGVAYYLQNSKDRKGKSILRRLGL